MHQRDIKDITSPTITNILQRGFSLYYITPTVLRHPSPFPIKMKEKEGREEEKGKKSEWNQK